MEMVNRHNAIVEDIDHETLTERRAIRLDKIVSDWPRLVARRMQHAKTRMQAVAQGDSLDIEGKEPRGEIEQDVDRAIVFLADALREVKRLEKRAAEAWPIERRSLGLDSARALDVRNRIELARN